MLQIKFIFGSTISPQLSKQKRSSVKLTFSEYFIASGGRKSVDKVARWDRNARGGERRGTDGENIPDAGSIVIYANESERTGGPSASTLPPVPPFCRRTRYENAKFAHRFSFVQSAVSADPPGESRNARPNVRADYKLPRALLYGPLQPYIIYCRSARDRSTCPVACSGIKLMPTRNSSEHPAVI